MNSYEYYIQGLYSDGTTKILKEIEEGTLHDILLEAQLMARLPGVCDLVIHIALPMQHNPELN